MVAKILVAVGLGRSTDVAVADGLQMSSQLNAHLTFLHVVTALDLAIIEAPAAAYLDPEQLQVRLDEVTAGVLAPRMAQSRDQGIEAACAVRRGISIARAIAQFAHEQDCELIIVGSRQDGAWRRLFSRSVACDLAGLTDLPIWVSGRWAWRQAGNLEQRRAFAQH